MDDERYFVGRDRDVATHAWQPEVRARRMVWIHGMHRVGKSSVARALGRAAAAQGAEIVWVDATAADGGDFGSLLTLMLDGARARKISIPAGRNVRERFEALGTQRHRPPVLFVLDEMDEAAALMSTSEQGILRRLVDAGEQVAFIAITCLHPARLVEEVADVRSRLLGVSMPWRVPALRGDAVREMFQRIATDLNAPELSEVADLVWERVGGHPISVMHMARVVVGEVDLLGGVGQVPGFLDERMDEFENELDSLWHQLRPETREALLATDDAQLERRHAAAARSDGFFTKEPTGYVRPRWLVERGTRLGASPTARWDTSNARTSTLGRLPDDLDASSGDSASRTRGQ